MEEPRDTHEPPAGEAIEGTTASAEVSALLRVAAHPASERGILPREIMGVVCDLILCEGALLFMYDEDADVLRMQSTRDDDEVVVPLTEPSIVRRVFVGGTPEVVNDVAADPDPGYVLADLVRARQVVVAPLTAHDKRLGVVAAVESRRGAFTHEDLRLLTVLADRAALTFENLQLRAALERQSQEMEALGRLSMLLAASDTLDHVVAESVRILGDLLACEKVALLLLDEDSGHLKAYPRTVGIPPAQAEALVVSLKEPSLCATVYRTGTPLVSNDALNDAWVGAELAELLDVKALMAAPLNTAAGASGVLTAINPRKGSFDEGDVRFMTLLGTRIASVIGLSLARERERGLVQRLREADRTKTDFVSILAHELRGPMTSIIGFGKSLQSEWDSIDEAKKLRIVDIVTKEVDRLSRLVSDLLDVSRMEAGSVRYEIEPLDLNEVIQSLLTVHTSLHVDHQVEHDVPPDLPLVLGDRDRIRQVFLNLVSNAVRYSPKNTTVTISAAVVDAGDGQSVRVAVRDEGIGIAPGDVERVFSKFAMLPKPGWTKKGSGLGLYITKGIVEGHGGRVWVESQPGKGSTFFFTLPVA